jgi:hypothetical protein
MKNHLKLLLACGSLLALVPCCAPLTAALPPLVAVVTSAILELDWLESAVTNWFQRHPDPKAEAEFHAAYQKAVAALLAAQSAVNGLEKLNQEQYDEAFADFKKAYLELRDLLFKHGIASPMGVGAFGIASETGLVQVPTPVAFSYQVR